MQVQVAKRRFSAIVQRIAQAGAQILNNRGNMCGVGHFQGMAAGRWFGRFLTGLWGGGGLVCT